MKINYGVISINDARKENIESIKAAMQCDPFDIDGFNGNLEQDVNRFKNLYPGFDVESYAKYPVFPLAPHRRNGEIGCWMSHYHMWNQIVNKNLDSAFVVEDDTHLTRKIVKFIHNNSFGLEFLMFGTWGELNYITKTAAEMFIAITPQLYTMYPMDEMMMHCVRVTGMRDLRGWTIPRGGKLPITKQLFESYGSDIGS